MTADPALEADVVGHVDASARAGADGAEQAVPAGEDASGEIGDSGGRHRRTVPAGPRDPAAPRSPRAWAMVVRRSRGVSLVADGRPPHCDPAPRPSPRHTAPGKRKLFKHPGRVAVVVVALLVVLNLGIILLNKSDTSPGGSNPLPSAVQTVSPEPGAIAGPIDTISVDLDDRLTGVLLVRTGGAFVEIPEDQLDRVPELGQISFRPGPGKEITKFPAGQNDVVVLYWSKTRVGGRPDHPASYAWSFQVKA